MMGEQTLFIEALERKDPAARAAFLDEACGDNPSLRWRLEQLLKRHEEADSLLELDDTSIDALLGLALEIERPGSAIGPYKLLEQIGEGGMGVV